MKAMLLHEPGKNLMLTQVNMPDLSGKDLLIKIHTTGLNFADLLLMEGNYQEKPPYPFSPGMEICGTVIKVGHDVFDFKEGDHIRCG